MFLNFVLVLHELVFVVAAPDVIDKYPLQTNINYINFNVLNCIKFKRRKRRKTCIPVHVSCFTTTSTGEYSPCSFNSWISTHNSIFLVNSDHRSAKDLALASCCSTSQPGLLRENPALRCPQTSMLKAPSANEKKKIYFFIHFNFFHS